MDSLVGIGEIKNADSVGVRGLRLGSLKDKGIQVAEGFILTEGAQIEDGLANRLMEAFDRLTTEAVIIRLGNISEEANSVVRNVTRDELIGQLLKMQNLHDKAPLIVQKTLNAELSGTLLGLNPEDGTKNEIWIESYWWLGESALFDGKRPEIALIDKTTGMVVMQEEGDEPIGLTAKHLEDLQVAGLASEHIMGWPTKLSWAFEDGQLYILDVKKAEILEETNW